MSDEPSNLLTYLDARQARIRAFISKYSELLPVIDCGIVLARALSTVSTVTNSKGNAKLRCGLMWQTISMYQLQSIELILSGDFDAGMALIRMASELARDVAVLGHDEKLLATWERREDDSDQYRKRFKFDQTPAGRAALDLYKFTSKCGIHGHQTALIHSERSVTDDNASNVVHFEVREDAPLDFVRIWLQSFFPLHALCAKSMGIDDPVKHEVYAAFISYVRDLKPILDGIKNHVGVRKSTVH